MSYATVAPGQQACVIGAAPPSCHNCATSTTPLWRRDESGAVLCNACGLFLKLHGRPRPSSLKTDIIKSRNRVKVASPGQRTALNKIPVQGQGLAAAHPDLSSSSHVPAANYRQSTSQGYPSDNQLDLEESFTNSDLIRDDQQSNIAPQHLFDGVTFDNPAETGSIHDQAPYPPYRNASRSPQNGHTRLPGITDVSTESNIDVLKTRVSELEVINELFRGRVTELEATEADAQRRLDEALNREHELRTRLQALEALLDASRVEEEEEARASKRARIEESRMEEARADGGEGVEIQVGEETNGDADEVQKEK